MSDFDTPAAASTRALLEATHWSHTPLGPPERWPQALRIAVGICLNSRFPMFVWWGPELINIYNDAYVPVLGKRHPAAFGRPARQTWAEIWDVVGPQADAVMTRGEATWNERVLLVMERNGYPENTYFTWSYSPIPDDHGGIGGVFCACTEETGYVAAERDRDRLLEQIRDERMRLAEAFEQSPSFLAVLDGPDHVFEFANERYYRLVGRREIIGKALRDAMPEVQGQGFFEILDRVYATGEPFVGTGMRLMVQREGEHTLAETFVDFVYRPLRGADGAVDGILAHGVDVTERMRVERTLRENEALFRQLADAMPQIVFSASPDGSIDYFNRQWYEYTGVPEGETGFESWKHVHTEEGLRRVMEVWPEALRTGTPYEIEYPLRRHDGVYRWHLGRALPIRDAAGRVVRWFGTNTDIHDRKQIEDRLAQSLEAEQAARSDAERASRMKDEFLATLSHELRTPLNAILGWAQIIRMRAELPPELAKGVETIERNARAQAQIIDDLLDMSAIISGKVRLEVRRVDFAALVQSALETVRPAAEAKRLNVLPLAFAGGSLEVTGDASRLQQVLWNLLSNAIKFTPEGGTIEVAVQRADGHLELAVRDSGEGIAREFLPYVFDRFRQADATTTRRYGGLGLGLSIVKQLVELHGGTVRAASAGPGLGSTLIVRLPLRAQSAAEAQSPDAHVSCPLSGEEPCGDVAGLDVLVVDDEHDARELVKRVLEDCRARVTTAASAEDALALVRERRFDVLVSDIGMPGVDGYELIRRVRGVADVPALALTAYARPDDRDKALAAGFRMHLAKPVEPAALIAMVARLARRR